MIIKIIIINVTTAFTIVCFFIVQKITVIFITMTFIIIIKVIANLKAIQKITIIKVMIMKNHLLLAALQRSFPFSPPILAARGPI